MAFPDTVPSGFTHKPAQVTPMSAPLSAPWALPCLSSSQLALDLVLGLRRFVGIPLFSHHFLKSPNGLPLLPPGLALQRLLNTEAGPQPRPSRAAPTGLPPPPLLPLLLLPCLALVLSPCPANNYYLHKTPSFPSPSNSYSPESKNANIYGAFDAHARHSAGFVCLFFKYIFLI